MVGRDMLGHRERKALNNLRSPAAKKALGAEYPPPSKSFTVVIATAKCLAWIPIRNIRYQSSRSKGGRRRVYQSLERLGWFQR